ncbi:MAG TPA: DUF3667 domain-containing protein [Sphingomonas sp.]|uniref:DUF3667 domain-containing protein n=1 Tax=Sphingomonas sp. TaxID=28214 RepID=UPI002CFEC4ED|nr:DUF3667 domain-containing protein [Sphingomonas sp.]HMI21201.1 DUF3667 domain-containing protein [Sphingomonas sp.]
MSEAGDGIGSLATGALWARTFGGRDAGAHSAHDEGGACANCGTERIGPFCHACGQMGHLHRNLMGLVHDIAHGVFHFEGKLWKTLPMLVWHPGRLTRRYVDGERAKFVSPMALFLFSVFLMFAVVSNLARNHEAKSVSLTPHGAVDTQVLFNQDQAKLAGLQAERAKITDKVAGAALDGQISDLKQELNGLQIGLDARNFISHPAANAPKVTHINTGWRWLDRSVSHMSENPDLTLYKMKTYGYKYSWALIPISLPFIWLLFAFRRDVGLYDHAIFSIYSLSFMSLGVVSLTLFGWLGLPGGLISLLAMFVPPVHMYRQLKGAYTLGRFGAFWRTFALLVITSITSSLFIAFLFYMGSD